MFNLLTFIINFCRAMRRGEKKRKCEMNICFQALKVGFVFPEKVSGIHRTTNHI